MPITVTQLTSLSGSNSNTNWSPQQGIRASVLDNTNPKFPRTLVMDNNFVVIQRGPAGVVTPVAYPITALLALAVATNPNLTWAPTFTTNPANTSANYGAAASFTIAVNSELSTTYQWKYSTNSGASFNNVPASGVFSGVTTVTLAISDVSALNGYVFQCVATNSRGATTSSNATLTVVNPAITAQPANYAGTGTFSHTFTTTAVGTATLKYQWYKSTDNGLTWVTMTNAGIYSGTTTASLVLTSATSSNNNEQYFCLVGINSNAGQASNPIPGKGGFISGTDAYLCSSAAVLTAT